MDNHGPGLKAAANETEAVATRTSKSGKKFTYRLKVIQQPLRARACGAGAKSSADRRPVDPPPIVELKIFEGSDGAQTDVTFSIHANYFLFATLEQARKQVQPRGVPPERGLTVLTGTPVAGMVCLERPNRAGYFIFPDLSVRHEGSYRLSFSLFEDLRDLDDEDRADDPNRMTGTSDGHATNRLEVRSIPFTVYSAKKFPGLTESTSLSRVVAEQGCRVRIRRDVRMRKRDEKEGKEWAGYEDATANERARMSATPEVSNYGVPTPHGYDPVPRPRSGSNASYHSLAPSAHPSRRTSLQEMNQAFHGNGYGTAPLTPHTNYPQTSPYGQPQGQTYQPTQFAQSSSGMQPPAPQYAHQPSYPPRPAPAAQPLPAQQVYYSYGAPPPPLTIPQNSTSQIQWSQPHSQSPQTYEHQDQHHRASMDYPMTSSHDHHRSSSQFSAPPSAISSDYNTPRNMQDNFHSSFSTQNYQQAAPPSQSYPHHNSVSSTMDTYNNYNHRPAPLEPVQPPTRTTGATTPLPLSNRPLFGRGNNELPPLNMSGTASSSAHKLLEPASPTPLVHQSQHNNYSYSNGLPEAPKRSYGNVFNERHHSQPLRHGQRPGTPALNQYSLNANDVDDTAVDASMDTSMQISKPLSYRRANGQHVSRAMEQHQQQQHQQEYMADEPGM